VRAGDIVRHTVTNESAAIRRVVIEKGYIASLRRHVDAMGGVTDRGGEPVLDQMVPAEDLGWTPSA